MKTDFNTLRKLLKKDRTALPVVKVALLGDASTQLLVQALCGKGVEQEINFNVYEADIGQIALQVHDAHSELYAFDPEYIVLLPSVFSEHKKFCALPAVQRGGFAAHFVAEIAALTALITSRSKARIIVANLPLLNDAVFGNYANKLQQSWMYQQRSINLELMKLAQATENLFIADFDVLRAQMGNAAFDPRLKVNADMDFSLDFLPEAAHAVSSIMLATRGVMKKCVIVDLDNTMWGGVIGDDGMEQIQVGELGTGKAFSAVQRWLKQLQERGIVLAVCSKNTEAIALEPFEKHPDMILRRDDFAVFVANWETKVDNIRHIQKVLNIGFDSMVFLDDNPVERDIVRQHVAGITVPELPEDPAEYLPYLCSLNLFETVSFSEEDAVRTKHYQEEAGRTGFQKSFEDEEEFLKSLQMKCVAKPFDAFTIPRVAQLSQRSNQFNLRTVRYTDADLSRMIADPDFYTCSFALNDKFGDYGLIAAVILQAKGKALFIDTWIMSCRVLKRGMENFTMNRIVEIARANGFATIAGEYLPTAKNGIVSGLLQEMNFSGNGTLSLDVATYTPRETFIAAG
jgi:FkbH-like protein